MLPEPNDTIVALSSPLGAGGRAIVRLSGSKAWGICQSFFDQITKDKPAQRWLHSGEIRFPGLSSGLPGDLYFWPTPRTYTGQDVVEIHTISCPPLIDVLITLCLNAGARAAQPGEFTMRAFLAGKLDLTKAEAVLGIIEAGDREELQQALLQLAGGVGQPLHHLRDDLLNLLADVEAGLDFTDEDIQFVRQKELLDRLTRALALVTLIRKQIDQRGSGPKPFRAILVGPPNAGKSTLFNALIGKEAALVSPQPGTTRDYLEATLFTGGIQILLIDTAGLRSSGDELEKVSQTLGKEQVDRADLVLWCQKADHSDEKLWSHWLPGANETRIVKVATQCDRAPAPPGFLTTSALTGIGLNELCQELAQRVRTRKQPPLAPSLSRCRHHVDACLTHLRQAHAIALHEDPAELLALELRGALDELGAIVGAIYTEDLLDRIFNRFCIGK